MTNISLSKQYFKGSKFNRKVPCLHLDKFYPGKYDLLKENPRGGGTSL